jgi:hypothetical protein
MGSECSSHANIIGLGDAKEVHWTPFSGLQSEVCEWKLAVCALKFEKEPPLMSLRVATIAYHPRNPAAHDIFQMPDCSTAAMSDRRTAAKA